MAEQNLSINPPASPAPTAPREKDSGAIASTVKYLLRTEVHTFAFSVAANALLSFFPFVVLLMTLVRRVFHSRVMYDIILELLRDYLPAGQEFLIRNLNALADAEQRVQIYSLLILLITSTGIFMPLEVALNRIWGFPNNRSYLGNQLISLGLTFASGVLALLSVALTAKNVSLLDTLLRGHGIFEVRFVGFIVMKLTAIPHLLALAQRQSAGACGCAGRSNYGIAFRSGEARLHPGASPAQFSGNLRPVCFVGEPHVLGISLWIAVAHRRSSLGMEVRPPPSHNSAHKLNSVLPRKQL
jgi:hypothetical protein